MIPRAALLAGGLSLGSALAISAALTPLVRRWALRRDFIDQPTHGQGHKTHIVATPVGGGIAITLAVILPMLVALMAAPLLQKASGGMFEVLIRWAPHWPHWLGGLIQKTPEALAIVAGALVLHGMGLVDDRRPLPALFKLVVQIVVALVLTGVFGIRAGEFFGPVLSIAITTLWIVTLTNAFNFMDNMDGLSAGAAALTSLVLAVSAMCAGQIFVPCLLLLMTGAVLGFLIYNFPPASIFMGDAGSLVIGYFLAVCAVLTTYYDPAQQRTPFGVLVPVLVFAIPLYDIVSVVIQRYRSGQSIFRSDCRHFSHRLVKLGLSKRAAVLTIYLATLATAMSAILLPFASWLMAIMIFGQVFCVVLIIAILEFRDVGNSR